MYILELRYIDRSTNICYVARRHYNSSLSDIICWSKDWVLENKYENGAIVYQHNIPLLAYRYDNKHGKMLKL